MPALRVTPVPDENELGPTCVTPDIDIEDIDKENEMLDGLNQSQPAPNLDIVKEEEAVTEIDPAPSVVKTPKKSPGFLDSLLKKIKHEGVNDTKSPKNAKFIQVKVDLDSEILSPMAAIPIPVARKRGRPMKTRSETRAENRDLSMDSFRSSVSCSSPIEESKFFGFDENEIPGLLATPRIRSNLASAFVDREAAKELDIKVEAPTKRDVDDREHEGLVCIGSKPPTLAKPKRLLDIVKPRTVAEKRQLMQKKKGLKFLMMENEARIFVELAKVQNKDEDYLLTCGSREINYQMLNALQHESVPYRRDAWRALSWLKTEKNRFYYKVAYVDGVKCNLLGSKGNFDGKKKYRINQTPFPKYFEPTMRNSCCRLQRIPRNLKINLDLPLEPEPPVEERTPVKKLLDFDKKNLISKPAPLSVKLRSHGSRLSEDECLGPVELCRMPPIQLEVFPKEGRPLDPKIIPYLKAIQPFESVTEKWARFAVSLLKHNANKDEKQPRFSFEIPYQNNRDRFFVRRLKKPESRTNTIKFSAKELDEPLNFTKKIASGDVLGQEVGKILTEMTNSVAISLSEDSFIQDDPDQDYQQLDVPFEPAQATVKTVKELPKSHKVV